MTHPNDLAFPKDYIDAEKGPQIELGLTKREYFAVLIMQGKLANSDFRNGGSAEDQEISSRFCVNQADALIKELSK